MLLLPQGMTRATAFIARLRLAHIDARTHRHPPIHISQLRVMELKEIDVQVGPQVLTIPTERLRSHHRASGGTRCSDRKRSHTCTALSRDAAADLYSASYTLPSWRPSAELRTVSACVGSSRDALPRTAARARTRELKSVHQGDSVGAQRAEQLRDGSLGQRHLRAPPPAAAEIPRVTTSSSSRARAKCTAPARGPARRSTAE